MESWSVIFGLIARHLLTGAAGWLVSHGLLAADGSNTEAFIGVGLALAGGGWSWYQKSGKVLIDASLAKARGLHPNALGFVILAAAGLLALPQPSSAADMPPVQQVVRKAAAPVAQPWAGLYIGINGAGAKTTGEFTMLAIPGSGDVRPSGAMAGVTVGAGAWLNGLYVGVEADGDYDFSKAKVACGFAPTDCKMRDGYLLTQRILIGATLPSMAAAGQRRGLASPAQWPIPLEVPANVSASTMMPYLTGGIAERRTQACIEAVGCNREWLIGWTAGGGVKIPISQAVSFDVGYLYINWNRHFNPAGAAVFPADFKATSEHVLKAGVQFHL